MREWLPNPYQHVPSDLQHPIKKPLLDKQRRGFSNHLLPSGLEQIALAAIQQNMHTNTGNIAKGDGPGPFEMSAKRVIPSRLPHQSDTSGGTNGQERSPYTSSQCHQQPLCMVHLWLHGQNGKHHRNIINDGRQDPHQNIGCGWPKLRIHNLGQKRQIAKRAKSANSQHNAKEEQ